MHLFSRFLVIACGHVQLPRADSHGRRFRNTGPHQTKQAYSADELGSIGFQLVALEPASRGIHSCGRIWANNPDATRLSGARDAVERIRAREFSNSATSFPPAKRHRHRLAAMIEGTAAKFLPPGSMAWNCAQRWSSEACFVRGNDADVAALAECVASGIDLCFITLGRRCRIFTEKKIWDGLETRWAVTPNWLDAADVCREPLASEAAAQSKGIDRRGVAGIGRA